MKLLKGSLSLQIKLLIVKSFIYFIGCKRHTHTGENMSNSTKSGFEIRADLLSQAEGLLTSNYQREVDAIYAHNDSFPNDKKLH